MRLLLFDIDGTLVLSKGAGSKALGRALAAHYGIPEDLNGVTFAGRTDPLIVRQALQRHRLDFNGQLTSDFLHDYARYLREELQQREIEVLPGVVALLKQLSQDSRFCLGLATGNVKVGAELKLQFAGLKSFFRFGGFGGDAANRTKIIQRACRRGLEVEPSRHFERVVVIGDTPEDIRHGRAAGACTLGVATGPYTLDDLQAAGADLALAALEPMQPVLDFLGG